MGRIRFVFVPQETCDYVEGEKTEVIMYRDGNRHTRKMDADDARWVKLAIEAGKQQAKDELKRWIG